MIWHKKGSYETRDTDLRSTKVMQNLLNRLHRCLDVWWINRPSLSSHYLNCSATRPPASLFGSGWSNEFLNFERMFRVWGFQGAHSRTPECLPMFSASRRRELRFTSFGIMSDKLLCMWPVLKWTWHVLKSILLCHLAIVGLWTWWKFPQLEVMDGKEPACYPWISPAACGTASLTSFNVLTLRLLITGWLD